MKYLKKMFELNKELNITDYKSILKYVKDNFKVDVFDFIDEFIDIEDAGVDVDIKFIVHFKNRDKYPKDRKFDIIRNNGTKINNIYQTELIDRRTLYEDRFEYGITYHGYPIESEDIVRKFIQVNFINRKNPSTKLGGNIHFLEKFKSIISKVCEKYQLKDGNQISNMNLIGYTSYNVLLSTQPFADDNKKKSFKRHERILF